MSCKKNNFVSLEDELDGHFHLSLSQLSEDKQELVKQVCGENLSLYSFWDVIDSSHRRRMAREIDYQNDPAMRETREEHWEIISQRHDIKRKKKALNLMNINSPSEQESHNRQIKELNERLKKLDEDEFNLFKPPKAKGYISAETRCKEYLKELMLKGPPKKNKAEFRDEAIRKFSGLTQRGFNDRSWPNALTESGNPYEWGKPGPKNSSH